MTRDKLYDAAFRYKKAGLWKKLWDSEVFAVKLKSGEIGYISIMGKNGEYNALALYIGDEGFGSYLLLTDMDRYSGSEFKNHEWLFRQKCLQAAFDGKEELLPEEVEEVRAYAKKNGIRLSGRNAFPHFCKYEPGRYPWKVKTQADMNALFEAVEAAVLLADMIGSRRPAALGIFPLQRAGKGIPLFSADKGKLVQEGVVPIPGTPDEKCAYIKAENEIAIASVKKLPKHGIWEAEIVAFPQPVQDDPEEAPYVPTFLMVVENKSHYLLPGAMMHYGEIDFQATFQEFADAWKGEKACPKEIRCRDERTYALLKDFCEKAGVKIGVYEGELPALDDAQDALWKRMSQENGPELAMANLIDTIFSLSDEELQTFPKPVVEQIRHLIAEGIFSKELAAALQQKLKGL